MVHEEQAPSILIVEDDEKLSQLLQGYFRQHGFRAEIESRGDRAAGRILSEMPDLVVLDLMLPGRDGTEVCREVRDRYHGGILMLTARQGDIDEVVGLEMGADDYLAKPVYPRTLLARARSVLRRTRREGGQTGSPATNTIRIGPLTLDAQTRNVRVDGTLVRLTATQFELLWVLAAHAGQVLDRMTLYRSVLQVDYDGLDRGLDVHVSRLRQKLTAAGVDTHAIRSIRGVGYLLALR